jgi:Tfp pilus assembly protein FimV
MIDAFSIKADNAKYLIYVMSLKTKQKNMMTAFIQVGKKAGRSLLTVGASLLVALSQPTGSPFIQV